MFVRNHRQKRFRLGGAIIFATVLFLASCVSLPRQAMLPETDRQLEASGTADGRELKPAGGNRPAQVPARRKNRPRLHIRYGVGYMQMNGLREAMRELDQAGLGEDYKYLGWVHTGPGFLQGEWRQIHQKNPDGQASHSIRFRDLRFDVFFARRWAAGIQFSPLGSYSIGGGKEIPVGGGLEGIRLLADFSGRGYLLTGSFIPFPGRSPDSSVIQFQAGVGVNHFTYAHHNYEGYRGPSLSRYFPYLMARAEYSAFSRHWSINFDASYKYARGHVPGTTFEMDDYSLTKGLHFHWQEPFPAFSADMGGFGFGVSLGFHL